MEEYLSVEEAAKQFHIAPYTVRLWVRQGRLPYFKVGNRILFHAGALDEFVQKKMKEVKE